MDSVEYTSFFRSAIDVFRSGADENPIACIVVPPEIVSELACVIWDGRAEVLLDDELRKLYIGKEAKPSFKEFVEMGVLSKLMIASEDNGESIHIQRQLIPSLLWCMANPGMAYRAYKWIDVFPEG